MTPSSTPSMFPPELRTAAFVGRWQILWRNTQDNIAQHSFFVAWYSFMVAETIEWEGPRDYLLLKALAHDLEETLTADIIGPVKKHIIDGPKSEEYIDRMLSERLGGLMASYNEYDHFAPDDLYDEVRRIVDTADVMDALLYLCVELRLGNKGALKPYDALLAKMEGKWRALPAPQDVLDKTWQTEVLPSIKLHHAEGGRGV